MGGAPTLTAELLQVRTESQYFELLTEGLDNTIF